MHSVLFTIAYFLYSFNYIFPVEANNSTNSCVAHGEYSLFLICLSCAHLDLGVKIETYCEECCNTTLFKSKQQKIEGKYVKAVLEFCFCKAPVYPQIASFVNSDMPAIFPNLEIKEVQGVDPSIKLVNGNGTVEYTVPIEEWTADAIKEFLVGHLEKGN